MSIIGEAFIAISPESAGFASKLRAQLTGSSFVQQLGAGPTAAIAAALAATAAIAVVGEKFEEVNHQIQEETGATGEELERLAETVKSAFGDVPGSLHNTATAVDELFRRGTPLGGALERLAKQELFLAKITKTELGPNVEATTAIFAKFNIPLAQQSRALDVLFKAQQQSGKGLDALLSPLRTSASILQQFGFGLEESAALIATLSKAGVNVQPALIALRLSFGKLAAEGKDPRKALADIVEQLTSGVNPTKAMANAIALFGKRSGAELATAIKAGRFSTADMLKLITDGRGGIIETGKETLSLGDKFSLLRDKIVAGLAPLGTKLVEFIEQGVDAAGPPIAKLINSISGLVTEVLPALLPLGVALGAIFRGSGPALEAFAAGIEALTSGLQALGSPLTGVILLLGASVVAYHAYATASLLAVRASIAFESALAFATGPIGLAVVAITALGFSLKALGSLDQGKKQRQAIADLTDTIVDKSGVLNEGVASLTDGFAKFFKASEKAISPNLPGVLGASGSSVKQLSEAVTHGEKEWGVYYGRVIRALAAAGNSPKALKAAEVALDRTRAAVITATRAEFDRARAAGLITKADAERIQVQATLADGTIDYARAVALLNTQLSTAQAVAAQAVEQADAQKLAVFKESEAYRELVAQLSQGAITADVFSTQLASMADVGAKAAKAVGDELAGAMKSFVDTAVGALPSAGSAIDKFAADVTSAQDAVTSALQDQASDVAAAQQAVSSAFESSASAVLSAQESLSDAIRSRDDAVAHAANNFAAAEARRSDQVTNAQRRLVQVTRENNAKIAEAQENLAKVSRDKANEVLAANAKLAHDRSPQAFIDNLNAQTKLTATFMGNLQKLVAEGFTPLAAELAKKGPEAAGALTANLATDPVKAAAANKAAAIGAAVTSSFRAFLTRNFDPIKNDGVELGTSLIDGIIQGISDSEGRLTKRITRLGDNVVQVLAGQWGIKSPSTVGITLGQQFGEGLAIGLASSVGGVNAATAGLGAASTNGLRRLAGLRLSPLGRSALAVQGQAGSERADARGQLDGLQMIFNEKVEPLHVAAEVAWRIAT